MATTNNIDKVLARRASVVKPVNREFISVDQTVGHVTITPDKVERVLRSAAQGDLSGLHEMLLLMDTDSRYSGILRSFYAPILASNLKVTPPRTKGRSQKKAIYLIEKWLQSPECKRKFPRLVLKTYQYGIRGIEAKWDIVDDNKYGKIALPTDVDHLQQTRFRIIQDVQKDNYLDIAVTMPDVPEGVYWKDIVDDSVFKVFTDDTDFGNLHNAGVARKCLPYFVMKKFTMFWWAQLNETWGEPTRVAYVPEGYNDTADIKKFLANMGRWMYGIFPDEVRVDFVNSISSGTVSTHKQFKDECDNEMAIAIHGQVQTSDGGEYGSYAKANVQWEVRRELVDLACSYIGMGYEWLVRHICWYNIDREMDPQDMPDVGPIIQRSRDKLKSAQVFDLARNFIEIPKSQVYEELEIRLPDDGEEVLQRDDRIRNGSGLDADQPEPGGENNEKNRKITKGPS